MSYETATVIGLVAGPVVAVLITLWHQDRAQKRAAKQQLFTTLMAYRKSYPIAYEWVNALNLIDVVYSNHPKVVQLWHELYDILSTVPLNENLRTHKYLELLSAMAKVLNYRSLQQTDIDKFYSPQAHGNLANLNYDTQVEFLRVLKATERLSVTPKESDVSVKEIDVPATPKQIT